MRGAGRGWIGAALGLAVAGRAHAGPAEGDPNVEARAVDAYAAAKAVFESPDPERAARCVDGLLALVAEPNYRRPADALHYAAVCAEVGGDVERSIALRRRALAEHPAAPATRLAEGALAKQLQGLARFAEAAEVMEGYAARWPAEREAVDMLWTAAALRHGLGQDDRARAALERVEVVVGRRDPWRAAEAYWARGALGPDTPAARRAHAEGYLKRHARTGPPQRRIVAQVIVGEGLWRDSCKPGKDAGPAVELLGLCVTLKTGQPGGCGTTTRWQVHARDARLVAKAQAYLRGVAAEVEGRGGALGLPDPWSPETAAAVLRARVMLADAELEASLRRVPEAVDLVDAKRTKDDERRFAGWLADKTREIERLSRRYGELAVKELSGDVATLARSGVVALQYADALLGVEVRLPAVKDVRPLFCEALREQTARLEAEGLAALSACLVRASVRGRFDGAARFCEAELQRRLPISFPPLRELFGGGPALDPGPRAFAVQESSEGYDEATE